MTTDKRKTAILYGDTEELLVDFTDEEVGQVFRALLAYINRGEEIETKDRAIRNLYKTIKAGIDRNLQAYEEKCEKNKQIALKREQLRRERREQQRKEEQDDDETRTYTNEHEEHERHLPNPNPNPNPNLLIKQLKLLCRLEPTQRLS